MKRIILITISMLMLGAVIFLITKRPTTFPPKNVACVDQAFEHIENVKLREGYGMSDFSFLNENVSEMHCAATRGMMFYEVSGTDAVGSTFYLHAIAGGMAASGADMVDDICYKKDGKTVTAFRRTGREATNETSTCSHENGFMSEAESVYDFIRQ
jgi:hypothetical protein